MTDIIELASKAGMEFSEKWISVCDTSTVVTATPTELQAFYNLARNAALEEAAVVCDDKIAYAKKRKTDLANGGWKKLAYTLQQIIDATEDTAEKIRALKEQSK